MDELVRELEMFETIAASDAMTNARVELEEIAEETERWAQIKQYVFPLLGAERLRLDAAVERLR